MRYPRYFLVVVLAAAASMAFAGSASATVLSNSGGNLPAGTVINATLTDYSALMTTSGEVLDRCSMGGLKGTTANAGSTTETVKAIVRASGFYWTGCNRITLEGGELEIHWISGTTNGTVTARGVKVTVEMVATLGSTCSYTFGTGKDIGTLVGGKGATLALNSVVEGAAGNSFLCPTSAKWGGDYKVTEPSELLVTER